MAEWFKAAVLKTVDGETRPGARIPLLPPGYRSTMVPTMKTRLLFLAASALMALGGEKASDSVTITTTPPGATVEWNRKRIGVTPLTYTVGEYAFNARKVSLFSKRLSQPVVLHVSLDGFIPKDVVITNGRIWTC